MQWIKSWQLIKLPPCLLSLKRKEGKDLLHPLQSMGLLKTVRPLFASCFLDIQGLLNELRRSLCSCPIWPHKLLSSKSFALKILQLLIKPRFWYSSHSSMQCIKKAFLDTKLLRQVRFLAGNDFPQPLQSIFTSESANDSFLSWSFVNNRLTISFVSLSLSCLQETCLSRARWSINNRPQMQHNLCEGSFR